MLPTDAHRRLIIRLGLLMAVFFPFAAFSEADYWNPVRLAGGSIGLEDALCAFNMGALANLPAVLLFRKKLVLASRPAPRMRRLLIVGAITLGSFFILRVAGLSSMSCILGAQLVASVTLLLFRPDLWRFCLAGGIGFLLLHFGMVRTFFWIWPAFASAWKSTPLWGLPVQGVPLGELAWALGFGVLWSLFAGYAFDFRVAVQSSVRVAPATEPEMELKA